MTGKLGDVVRGCSVVWIVQYRVRGAETGHTEDWAWRPGHDMFYDENEARDAAGGLALTGHAVRVVKAAIVPL